MARVVQAQVQVTVVVDLDELEGEPDPYVVLSDAVNRQVDAAYDELYGAIHEQWLP